MKNLFLSVIVLSLVLNSNVSFAQDIQQSNKEYSVVFGLNQPIVEHGFNFELNYWMTHFVIDYSHGFGLEFTGSLVSNEAKAQHVSFNVTNSLGVGFGYRFTKRFNIRIEPKMHMWDMYYSNQFKEQAGKITGYNTYTLGLGAYYRWTPFEKINNALKGITIDPSIRWWPNVASSLKNNEYAYYNKITDTNETIKANNIGISNTPWFANISIGYTFGMKNNK
jgi:hypothetical protein